MSIGQTGFKTCHIVCLTWLTHMVETVVSQTAHTRELKIEDKYITLHHLDHQIHIVTNEAFIIEGQTGQVIHFTALIHVSTPIMSFILPTLLLVTWKHHQIQGKQFIRAIYYHPS